MRTKLINQVMKAALCASLFILACQNLSAQGRISASGTVIDENKTPMG